jgi:Uma2 family endonuclease
MSETRRRPGLTGDDLLRMPSGNGERYELIEGSLVVMEPPGAYHGFLEARITYLLMSHALEKRLGRVLAGEPGFFTRGDPSTVRAPDIAFLSYDRFPAEPLFEGYERIAPDLVVEIGSPHDRRGEIDLKTREWLDFGVRAVWEVDPEQRRVRVSTAAGTTLLEEGDVLEGGGVVPGFAVPVRVLFED